MTRSYAATTSLTFNLERRSNGYWFQAAHMGPGAWHGPHETSGAMAEAVMAYAEQDIDDAFAERFDSLGDEHDGSRHV